MLIRRITYRTLQALYKQTDIKLTIFYQIELELRPSMIDEKLLIILKIVLKLIAKK